MHRRAERPLRKGGRNTRTEKDFFVRSELTDICYCGKCGRRQLGDRYNMRKHAAECGFDMSGEIPVLEEGSDLGYRLEGSEKGLRLILCRPKLQPIRGFSDRFYGIEWEPVFEAVFPAGSKRPDVVKNATGMKMDTLLSLIRAERIVPIESERDADVIRTVFPGVIDVFSLQMFAHIYQNKGYNSERILTEEAERKLLSLLPDESAWEGLTNDGGENKIPILAYLYRFQGEHYILQLVLNDKGEKTVFLFSRGYCACNKKIRLEEVIGQEFYLAGKAKTAVRRFDAEYPEYLLGRYAAKSENILFPLLAADYHCGMELAAKSGLPGIAENYAHLSTLNRDPALIRNLRELLGLPMQVLRALTRDQACDAVIGRMREIYSYNPAYLQFDAYTASMIEFYMRANLTHTRMRNGIEGTRELSDRQILQILKYLRKHPQGGHYYCDYLNACATLGEYPFGLTPDIPIREAHDRTVARIRNNLDESTRESFRRAVGKDSYRALATCFTEEDEERFGEDPFFVTIPNESDDLYIESENMHNCVRLYVPRVAQGWVRIYFLRQKSDPDKSYGTLEVSEDGNRLCQAKAFANERLRDNAQRFVVKWCRLKGIRIDTWDITNKARSR